MAPPKTPPHSPRGRDLLVERHDYVFDRDELVPVAKLGRPWGVRGAINVRLHNPHSDVSWADEVVWLHGEGFPLQAVEVDRWEDKGGKLLLRFGGVNSPEDARSLTHLEILVPAEWLPETRDDEHYVVDLIGLQVIDEERGELGRIVDVFPTGGADVWVIKAGKDETLIPAVKEFVRSVDHEAGVVTVAWPGIE